VSNDTSRTIVCAHAIGTARPVSGAQTITIKRDRLSSVEPTSAPAPHRLLAMPALVNAHDHGRAIRTSSIGADAKPLETWLNYLALFPSVDPYLAAATSFANSALGGAIAASRPMSGWRHSAVRTRLHANSLLTGNFSGNFAFFGLA
jgi:hypothetical protein